MTPLLLAVALAATPKLAVPSFTGGRADLASFCAERLADELGRAGFEVVSEKQIGALLGLERQRQLLGCTDAASACMAELTDALGADGLVSGSLVLLGSRIEVDVRVFSAKTGTRLAVAHGEAASEEEIPAVLAKLAEELAPAVRGEAPRSKRRIPRSSVLVPIGLSFASAIGAAVMFGLAALNHGELTGRGPVTPRYTYEQGNELAHSMGLYQALGSVFLGVIAACVVASIVLGIISGDE